MNHDFRAALDAFTRAAIALVETMDCTDPSGYIDGYPFPLSFDEQVSAIVNWRDKCQQSDDKRESE